MTPSPLAVVLERIKKLDEGASPPPWKPFDCGPWGGQGAGVKIGEDTEGWPVFGKHTEEPHVANSFFTAEARTLLPLLAKAVELANGTLSVLKASLELEKSTVSVYGTPPAGVVLDVAEGRIESIEETLTDIDNLFKQQSCDSAEGALEGG